MRVVHGMGWFEQETVPEYPSLFAGKFLWVNMQANQPSVYLIKKPDASTHIAQ